MRAPAAPRPGFRTRLWHAWDSDVAWSFRHSPVAILASVIALVLLFSAVLAPLIAPQNAFDAATLNLMEGFTRPGEPSAVTGRVFMLGTDDQGRDMLSAILYGSRVSLLVGFASVVFSLALGVSLGLMAGYLGGRTDAFIMRIADIQLSFPAILIALLVFGVARGLIAPQYHEQAAIIVLIVAIGLSNWAQYARTVRGSTLVEKNKEYVMSARVIGRSAVRHHGPPRAAERHRPGAGDRHHQPRARHHRGGDALVPRRRRAADPALARHADPRRPAIPVLRRVVDFALPALDLVLLALSINLLGDWLRDALNPKLR